MLLIELFIRGYMTQFIPHRGIYVIARRWHRHGVLTIINGTRQNATMEMKRYQELFDPDQLEAADVITGQRYSLRQDLQLTPRQTLVLEY